MPSALGILLADEPLESSRGLQLKARAAFCKPNAQPFFFMIAGPFWIERLTLHRFSCLACEAAYRRTLRRNSEKEKALLGGRRGSHWRQRTRCLYLKCASPLSGQQTTLKTTVTKSTRQWMDACIDRGNTDDM